jgi:DNA repair protein RecN (Recombination protein N)
MLNGLDIRDMLIIDRLELAFRPGLNVLTGETGAGKSILLDSLGFVLGWRGRAELLRAGSGQGEVTAWFDIGPAHPAHAVLEDAGLPHEDDLILRRINTPDGRKTAWVNDRRVSGEVLRALSDTLVELHGQHDDRGLLNPRGHRRLLDAYGQLEGAVAAMRQAWADLRAAEKMLAATEAAIAAARAEEEYLRHACEELQALGPEPGEEARLDARRRLMQGAERVRGDVSRAAQAMGGEGAEGLLHDARRWLEAGAETLGHAGDGAIDALSRALVELGEAQDAVARLMNAMEFDPGELEAAEERLFAIRALARKHGVAPDDLAAFAEDLAARLAVIDRSGAELTAQERAAAKARAAYDAAAADLSRRRNGAAGRLDAAMAGELAPLKMENAVFTTEIAPADPGPEGIDAVAFTVATNPGAPAGPLNRIASGGELSRFLLALKVCLTAEASGLTLIFDEIDRGVGGATADAVGRRLAALAQGAQVLVVTHSPQVAAQGQHHWRVEKQVAGGVTLSRVHALDDAARVDEIARMLAGDTVTDEARGAARALLGG